MGLYQLSDNFQPVGRLWLRLVSEPHVVGRLETGPRVGVGVFSVGGGGCLQGELSPGGLSPRTFTDS